MIYLNWENGGGMLPVIVQDVDTLQVLMLGYMNAEALQATRDSGKVVFYSRSKQRLWQKGESTGHTLTVVKLEADCDADSLLVTVRPQGPTCHRETTSCFGEASAPGLGFVGNL